MDLLTNLRKCPSSMVKYTVVIILHQFRSLHRLIFVNRSFSSHTLSGYLSLPVTETTHLVLKMVSA